nr:immunoglobulin heavy chain junction region [Mus musculus]
CAREDGCSYQGYYFDYW